MNTYEEPAAAPAYEASQGRPEPSARPSAASGRRDFFDDPRRKSPILALVLSAMPGLGQVYVGYYQQGFTNVLVVASVIALLNFTVLSDGGAAFFGLFLAFYWLYNMVDAWRRAVFYNNALAGIAPGTLPSDFPAASGRGSLAGGAALVVVGLVLLSNTLFGMSLAWLEQWWPVAFIV
ncbi:MAG: hypothetical protein EHM24_08620, partial [Acidobacteria bacterium]